MVYSVYQDTRFGGDTFGLETRLVFCVLVYLLLL